MNVPQSTHTAGILILNWNGCELLRKHLPSVVHAAEFSGLPVVVADNGSTDGSLGFLRGRFPDVATIELRHNLGYGRGYNAAIARVNWDLVILLNNDMSVEEDFAAQLLKPFESDESLFATSAQVFLEDPSARREETGRTSARIRHGELELAHLPLESEDTLVPVFWLGGGSAAVSRTKFQELGGFEELYSPFYVEDVDLSFRAWQRGWPILLVPRSRVTHTHRGSTSRLDSGYVNMILDRNRLLFVWLNARSWRLLAQHVAWLPFHAACGSRGRSSNIRGLLAAMRCLPAVRARRRVNAQGAGMRDVDVFSLFARDWD
jgi:GT2 family glycosyltransferase